MKDNKEQFFKPDQFNSFADNDGFKELNFEELEGVAGRSSSALWPML